MRLILLGPPGVGKGTQGKIISKNYNIPHLSTGDILRREMALETPLGLSITELMNSGNYVPDEMIDKIVQERINEDDCKQGYILDGYPRTIAQAEYFQTLNQNINAVLYFNAPDEVLIKRIMNRSSNREDDNDENTIRHRLSVYKENTAPLIEFYSDKLIKINATELITRVTDIVKTKLTLMYDQLY